MAEILFSSIQFRQVQVSSGDFTQPQQKTLGRYEYVYGWAHHWTTVETTAKRAESALTNYEKHWESLKYHWKSTWKLIKPTTSPENHQKKMVKNSSASWNFSTSANICWASLSVNLTRLSISWPEDRSLIYNCLTTMRFHVVVCVRMRSLLVWYASDNKGLHWCAGSEKSRMRGVSLPSSLNLSCFSRWGNKQDASDPWQIPARQRGAKPNEQRQTARKKAGQTVEQTVGHIHGSAAFWPSFVHAPHARAPHDKSGPLPYLLFVWIQSIYSDSNCNPLEI